MDALRLAEGALVPVAVEPLVAAGAAEVVGPDDAG